MASLEQAERLGGVGLLGVPTFDFFVWALDNYARGELLMNLREQLPPWLVNPAFVFVCMCGGLALIYLSHQQQLRRILARPSQLVDVEQYRGTQRPGWLLPLLWVAFGALVAAPVLALAYSLAYKGTAPAPQAHLKVPPICKTADCFPPRPQPTVVQKPSVINSPNCPKGICPTAPNFGTQTVYNAPPSRLLDDEHANKFKAAVAGVDGVYVFPRGTDQDVIPLATQLCSLFPQASCPGIDGSTMSFPQEVQTQVVGLHCFLAGDEIKRAFQGSGLTCVYENGPFIRRQAGGGTATLYAPTILIGNQEK
jgi:hypothetical protein